MVIIAHTLCIQFLLHSRWLIETCFCGRQATYDEDSGEFVINTPTDTASKFWIGGAAQHGKVRLSL